MIIILYYLELSAAAINVTFEKQEPVNIWLDDYLILKIFIS